MQVERKILCTVDQLVAADWSKNMLIISKLASYQQVPSRPSKAVNLKHTQVRINIITTTNTDNQHCQLRILKIIVYLKPKKR